MAIGSLQDGSFKALREINNRETAWAVEIVGANDTDNIRIQILNSVDREQAISYDDFGNRNQRITQIDYTSDTYPGVIARKSFIYTQVGNRFRLDNINWTIV